MTDDHFSEDAQRDQSRLLVSTFIVGTTVAIMVSQSTITIDANSMQLVILGAAVLGLLTSSLFACLFIMAKGYELRYRTNPQQKFIDKYNFILYNLAVWAYVPVVLVLVGSYVYEYLIDASFKGDALATLALYGGTVAIIIAFNFNSIRRVIEKARNESAKKPIKSKK